jgi:hypothetical protein
VLVAANISILLLPVSNFRHKANMAVNPAKIPSLAAMFDTI